MLSLPTKDISTKINVLIVGTGMYVCGRGTDGYGTVLPAVLKARKAGIIDKVLVASQTKASFVAFDAKLENLKKATGTDLQYRQYPSQEETNPSVYRDAIRDLPDPAAVLIVTPDHLHTEIALAAIEYGKHVLVVKPLAPTVAEAQRLIFAAGENGIYGAVEFHKRWDWANLKLRDSLASGVLGDPLYFHVEYSQRKMIPAKAFSAWVEHTNIFQYLGVHYVDLIHFVTNDYPRRMIAIGQHKWLSGQGIPTYDSIQVLIEWSQGFTSTFLTNWIDPNNNAAMSNQMIKVIGTKGRLESDQTNRGLRLTTDLGGIEEINPYFCQPYNIDHEHIELRGYGVESVVRFLKDVYAIANDICSPTDLEGQRPTFKDALVSTAVIEGANLSLNNDSNWVHFDQNLEPHLEGRR